MMDTRIGLTIGSFLADNRDGIVAVVISSALTDLHYGIYKGPTTLIPLIGFLSASICVNQRLPLPLRPCVRYLAVSTFRLFDPFDSLPIALYTWG